VRGARSSRNLSTNAHFTQVPRSRRSCQRYWAREQLTAISRQLLGAEYVNNLLSDARTRLVDSDDSRHGHDCLISEHAYQTHEARTRSSCRLLAKRRRSRQAEHPGRASPAGTSKPGT